VSVKAIQELSYAATQSQSTTAAMENSLKGLSSAIGRAAQDGSDDFSRLGISVRDANGHVKSADRILLEVGRRFKALHLSMAEQEHFASALGIDSSLLQLLNKTGSAIDGLRDKAKKLGILTKKQIVLATDYTKSVNSMRFSLDSFRQLIAVGAAPDMRRMSDAFTDLLVANKGWIIGGVKFAIKWVSILIQSLRRMLPAIAAISVAMIGLKIATLGWAGALVMIRKTAVVGALVALYLVVDDLITAFKGGKSVIAGFYHAMTGRSIVNDATAGFKVMKDVVMVLFHSLEKVWAMLGKIGGWMISGGQKLAGMFHFGAADLTSDVSPSAVSQTLTSAVPQTLMTYHAPNGSHSQTTDNRQVVQNNTITIKTNDPEGTGRAVDSALNHQLDNANIQLSAGGR